jgi:polyhydroxyalkanoate synthase
MPFLFLALYWYVLYLQRTYAHVDRADERHTVTTQDGFRLAVFRYRPVGVPRREPPVFLVHGLGANRLNFDAGEECSLARYLAEHGFDCWLVDLRGCGESVAPGRRWGWSFDDHVEHDIPAAVAHVLSVTGHAKLNWVGHSMGGMLLYAYLLRHGQSKVHRGVTLGAPVQFSPRDDGFYRIVHWERFLRLLPQVPVGNVGRLVTPLLGVVNPAFVKRQLNVSNVDWPVLRRAFYNTSSHLAPGVLLQFVQWIKHNDFHARDGFSYSRNLSQITTPLLVIAGRGDRLVPKHDVREAFERVSSTEKQYLELCCEQGFVSDYGHIDLIFGRQARHEVFPKIVRWLAA